MFGILYAIGRTALHAKYSIGNYFQNQENKLSACKDPNALRMKVYHDTKFRLRDLETDSLVYTKRVNGCLLICDVETDRVIRNVEEEEFQEFKKIYQGHKTAYTYCNPESWKWKEHRIKDFETGELYYGRQIPVFYLDYDKQKEIKGKRYMYATDYVRKCPKKYMQFYSDYYWHNFYMDKSGLIVREADCEIRNRREGEYIVPKKYINRFIEIFNDAQNGNGWVSVFSICNEQKYNSETYYLNHDINFHSFDKTIDLYDLRNREIKFNYFRGDDK